jgi:signal transduction histidine kinase
MVRDRGADGAEIYLGLSDVHAVQLMDALLLRLGAIWIGAVCLAWVIAFTSARRMLARVESISDAADRIRSEDLSSRIPEGQQVDEVARMARTLNRMLDRVAHLVNQLRSLTDTVAHELKSSITSIRGRLESALVSPDAERAREAAILAIEDLDRLAAFITTTLDVAEAEGGGLRIRRAPVDFSALVRQLVALYEPAMADRQQKVHPSIADGVVMSLDVSLMRRALANLLDNALNHTRPGTTVAVALTADDREVVLQVDDDGAGFPAEVEKRMFARFVKGGGGHGLGLAFSRAIVVAHGGRMEAGNHPMGGALVRMTLPREDHGPQP